jgi:hypothetical protein
MFAIQLVLAYYLDTMLLVTFHGGSGGTNNIYGYSTKDGTLETQAALAGMPKDVPLDQLRGMAAYKGNLYVVNGSATNAYVFVFGPPKKGPTFDYLDTVIGAGQSIMHPFGITFDPSSPTCYVSNQDSNVVAQVNLTAKHGAVTGSLGKGCQSKYLSDKYPPPDAFLDGTFVASQIGELKGVQNPIPPDVSEKHGGLGVKGQHKPLEPSNSVRDVAIANGILFVCDEVGLQINMYELDGGKFLGSGSLKGSPTHFAIDKSGLWVSADGALYWSALPASVTGASLSFKSVVITLPANNKIGGISFDNSGNVYVIFQDGTHTKGTGSISKFAVTAGSPPTLTNGATFATTANDTPEFCLWVSDSNWPS